MQPLAKPIVTATSWRVSIATSSLGDHLGLGVGTTRLKGAILEISFQLLRSADGSSALRTLLSKFSAASPAADAHRYAVSAFLMSARTQWSRSISA